MRKTRKQLIAKVLCVSMLLQLGAFPSGAAGSARIGANGTVYADGYEEYIINEDPSDEELEEELASGSNAAYHTASGSNASYDTASGSNAKEKLASSSNMPLSASEGLVVRALEEDKANFSLGTVSKISEADLGGNILQITSGWNSSRLKGVAEFKNANKLFQRDQFTLQAYVYHEGDNEKAAAFTVGEKTNYFSVNLTPAALKYAAGKAEKTVGAEERFQNSWICLSISYEENEEEGQVAVYADGEELIAPTGIGFKLSELNGIKAYVGGTFAETSFMGAGKYDNITVYDWADAVELETDVTAASNVVDTVEEKVLQYNFSDILERISTQEEAEAAVAAWVMEEFADILDAGIVIRPSVTSFEAPGEPYREAFEGKPGKMTFSFKIFSESATAMTEELDVVVAPAGNAGEIPVYDSFSGTAKGTGSKEYSMWLDTEGKHIQAHGGQVQALNEAAVQYDLDENGEIEDKNVWLWYGEDKTRNGKPIDGVKCYVSTDLYNWTDKGTVLRTHDLLPAKLGDGSFAEGGVSLDEDALETIKAWAEMEAPTEEVGQEEIDMAKNFVEAYVDSSFASGYDDEKLELAFWNLYTGYCIAERPKMLYNEGTGQYVVVYHQDAPAGSAIKTYVEEILANGSSDNTGSRYSRASMGFAVSDSPFGPFKLVNVQRMNGYESEYNPAKLGMARDMNVFLDDTDIDQNGIPDAYAIYSSEENAKLYISLLNEEYTGPATEGSDDTMELPDGSTIKTFATRVLPDNSREAPAVFKHDGWYYMITSGTSGWDPNKATYYRAQHIFGPWEAMGDPCEGGSGTTFRSQSTSVIPVDAESGQFIYMGDRWRTESGSSAQWYSSYMWVPIQISSDHRIELKNVSNWDLSLLERLGTVKINSELPAMVEYGSTALLPATVNVTVGKNTYDTPVAWTAPTALGTQVVEGTLTELDREISFQAEVVARDVLYFVDCGAAGTEGRDYFNKITEYSAESIKNAETPDQAYVAGSWGYEGNNTKARATGDVYEMLRYVSGGSGRNLSYRFDDLEEGTYSVYLGFFSPTTWPSDNRTAKISVKSGGQELAGAEHKIASGVKNMVAFDGVSIGRGEDLNIMLSPKNTGSNTDVQISYIAVCKKPVISVETAIPTIDMDHPVLPDKLMVNVDGVSRETRVTWNDAQVNGLKKSIGLHTLNAIMTDLGNRSLSVEVMAAPSNAVYFADCGSAEAGGEFSKIAELSAGLLRNPEVPDQAYAEGGWGYEGEHTVARASGTGLYEMLRYVQKNSSVHNISYRFDGLEAGTYEIRMGFFDPWYQYSKGNRVAGITAEVNGEPAGKTVSHTLKDTKDMVTLSGLVLSDVGTIRVNLDSVNPGNDTDVMVSYIAVCKTADAPEDIYYTVNFDVNGGSAVESQEVKEGERVEKPENPTRAGYTFIGWYQDAAYTAAWDFAADTVTADTTIYAKWEKDKEPEATYYTVSFDAVGGTTVAGQKVKEGELAKKPKDPTRTGYTFAGWYQDAAYTAAWDFAKDTVSENTTLYAKWAEASEPQPEEKEYTVVFVSNGGTSVPDQTVKEGGKVTAPEKPQRSRYVFGGWYQDEACKIPWDFDTDIVTRDTTLYAKWTRRSSSDSDDNSDSSDTSGSSVSMVGDTVSGRWIQSGNTWKFRKSKGGLAKNEWGRINGVWYYFKEDATMIENSWLLYNNNWYYLGPGGGMYANRWMEYQGFWYYLNADGSMAKDTRTPDGYLVDAEGRWVK